MKHCKRWAPLLGGLLLWAAAATAYAVPVYHMESKTLAPYVKTAAFVTEAPFAADAPLLRVDVLDVRTSDCFVVTLGEQTLLIDGGLTKHLSTLEAYMQKHALDGFDMLLLTHAHPDHAQAQIELVRAGYRVGKLLSAYDDANEDKIWQVYRKALDQAGVPRETFATGDVIRFGDATLTVYQRVQERQTINDQSVAIMLQYGDARLFLASDITGNTQRWLLEEYGASAFACDVLKSAHHGKDPMAPAFLDALSPSACVVTTQKAFTSAHTRQLKQRDIARYYLGAGTVHLRTDGSAWLLWQQKDAR